MRNVAAELKGLRLYGMVRADAAFADIATLVRNKGLRRILFLIALSPAGKITVWRRYEAVDLAHVESVLRWLERVLGEEAPDPRWHRLAAH